MDMRTVTDRFILKLQVTKYQRIARLFRVDFPKNEFHEGNVVLVKVNNMCNV